MRKILLLLVTATLCILLLTGCGESVWTVSISGEQSQLSAGDAAALQKLLRSGQWQDGLTDCAPAAYLTDRNDRRVDYCCDCGIFNDLANGRYLKLSDEGGAACNALLSQYGVLGDRG